MKVTAYFCQIIGLAVGSLLSPLVMFSSSTLAQTIVSEDMANSNRVGLQFENSEILNEGKLVSHTGRNTQTNRSVGRCVGRLYIPPTYNTTTYPYTTPGAAKARFISRTLSPGAGLRVTIRNTTSGIDQKTLSPYTDREYNQGDRSEAFTVQQDTSHSSRYFAVTPGLNTLTYQIKRNDEVVESGTFTTVMTLETVVDKQPQDSNFDSTAFQPNSLDQSSNQCEPPSIPDMTMPEMPDIPTLEMPDLPLISP
jgi:hypothetical protein